MESSSFVFSLCVTFLWEIVALDRAIIYPIWLYSKTLLDKYSVCKPISFSFVWARFITSATKFVIVIWESSSSHKAAGREKEITIWMLGPHYEGFSPTVHSRSLHSSCIVVGDSFRIVHSSVTKALVTHSLMCSLLLSKSWIWTWIWVLFGISRLCVQVRSWQAAYPPCVALFLECYCWPLEMTSS